jgi:hypothetical protein
MGAVANNESRGGTRVGVQVAHLTFEVLKANNPKGAGHPAIKAAQDKIGRNEHSSIELHTSTHVSGALFGLSKS